MVSLWTLLHSARERANRMMMAICLYGGLKNIVIPFHVKICYSLFSRTSTMPRPPSTRTRSPVLSRMVAFLQPTTAGMPNSRATIAACESGAPTSVTTAARRIQTRRVVLPAGRPHPLRIWRTNPKVHRAILFHPQRRAITSDLHTDCGARIARGKFRASIRRDGLSTHRPQARGWQAIRVHC